MHAEVERLRIVDDELRVVHGRYDTDK